jgi:hypothetical protein
MATAEELNDVIRHSDVRWTFTPGQKKEVVSFLGPNESPLSICRIKSLQSSDGLQRGKHMNALLTNQRVIFINGDTQHVRTQFYFRPTRLDEIESASTLEKDGCELTLRDQSALQVGGWKKSLGRWLSPDLAIAV